MSSIVCVIPYCLIGRKCRYSLGCFCDGLIFTNAQQSEVHQVSCFYDKKWTYHLRFDIFDLQYEEKTKYYFGLYMNTYLCKCVLTVF